MLISIDGMVVMAVAMGLGERCCFLEYKVWKLAEGCLFVWKKRSRYASKRDKRTRLASLCDFVTLIDEI
jgi:hypothetical protein